MIEVQSQAARVVGEVLAGANLDRALEAAQRRMVGRDAGERAAVQSLAFDTVRHAGLLSAQLDRLLTKPASDPAVKHLLLVALAQLQFSKAAPHAIVTHAVDAVANLGAARAKPLVNGVLRSYLRDPDAYARGTFTSDKATWDFPAWWVKRIRREYPRDWQSMLRCAGHHPPMWLRVNRRRTDPASYLECLAAAGLDVARTEGESIQLAKPIPVARLPGFEEGWVSVQDLGAQQAMRMLGAGTGHRVLDACAAPGGKAAHLLEAADIALTCLDLDSLRLGRVGQNLTRLKLAATLRCADAADLSSWWEGETYDRILVDVPCSGSGVVRRHPDIKWIRRESDLDKFARTQRALLAAMWNCLAIGGRLLYATCSVFRAENQDIVEQFLRENANARQLPIPGPGLEPGGPSPSGLDMRDGQLIPNDLHDGFYYALLEKAR